MRQSLAERLLRARCAFSAADYMTSLQASDSALELDQKNSAALYWKGKSAQKLAVRALEVSTAEAPESFRTHLLLGELYRQKQEDKLAQEEFSKALALKPDDPTAHLGLAGLYYYNTQFLKALGELEPLLKEDPTNPEARLLMGEVLVKQHQFSDAIPSLKMVLQEQSANVPRVHFLLATCYAAQGQTALAISELKPVLSADVDGSFHYQMYRIYKAIGDDKSAAAALERSEMLRKKTAKEQQELIEGSESR